MNNRLLRCRQCNEVINLTEYDSCPEYSYDEEKQDFTEEQRNDRQCFDIKHKGHMLEELIVKKNSFVSESSYWEPSKVSFFEATNGKENFVVKKWRKSIEDPVSYELIKGKLETYNLGIEVQSEDILKQMKADMPDWPEFKTNQLIMIIQEVASYLDPKEMERVGFESDNPLIYYSNFDATALKSIFNLCKKIFDDDEIERIKRFIHQNSDYDGVIALRVKRGFRIKSSPASTKHSLTNYPVADCHP